MAESLLPFLPCVIEAAVVESVVAVAVAGVIDLGKSGGVEGVEGLLLNTSEIVISDCRLVRAVPLFSLPAWAFHFGLRQLSLHACG